MRIALVAPPWFRVPPDGHGGVETLLAVLAPALRDAGDDVVLYSVGASEAGVECRWLYADPQRAALGTPQRVGVECAHVLFAYTDIAGECFDVVHDNCGYVGASMAAVGCPVPVLCTPHKPISELSRRVYAIANRSPRVFFSAISDYQRREMAGLDVVATVHNAVALDSYPLVRAKDDYLVDVTRICPEKAPHRAIEVARLAGLPLKLAGMVETNPEAQEYFSARIEPHLGEGTDYVGEVGFDEKIELLAHARALVFPVEWPEPFGLVVAEALACGTPVLASPRGAIPEIVRDGVEGFLAEDPAELAGAVARLDEIDAETCRRRVAGCFSPSAMAARYRSVYQALIDAAAPN
jgi:glycosyltransferase involved in cell wall biosynthesis